MTAPITMITGGGQRLGLTNPDALQNEGGSLTGLTPSLRAPSLDHPSLDRRAAQRRRSEPAVVHASLTAAPGTRAPAPAPSGTAGATASGGRARRDPREPPPAPPVGEALGIGAAGAGDGRRARGGHARLRRLEAAHPGAAALVPGLPAGPWRADPRRPGPRAYGAGPRGLTSSTGLVPGPTWRRRLVRSRATSTRRPDCRWTPTRLANSRPSGSRRRRWRRTTRRRQGAATGTGAARQGSAGDTPTGATEIPGARRPRCRDRKPSSGRRAGSPASPASGTASSRRRSQRNPYWAPARACRRMTAGSRDRSVTRRAAGRRPSRPGGTARGSCARRRAPFRRRGRRPRHQRSAPAMSSSRISPDPRNVAGLRLGLGDRAGSGLVVGRRERRLGARLSLPRRARRGAR